MTNLRLSRAEVDTVALSVLFVYALFVGEIVQNSST